MSTQYHAGDVIRFQLSPNGVDPRWTWNEQGILIDRGYTGPWVDGIIIATTFEQGDLIAWPQEPIMVVHYDPPDKDEEYRVNMCIEGHPAYPDDLTKYPGFPKPSRERAGTPRCDCGAGNNAPGHSDWCSRLAYLKAYGLWNGP